MNAFNSFMHTCTCYISITVAGILTVGEMVKYLMFHRSTVFIIMTSHKSCKCQRPGNSSNIKKENWGKRLSIAQSRAVVLYGYYQSNFMFRSSRIYTSSYIPFVYIMNTLGVYNILWTNIFGIKVVKKFYFYFRKDLIAQMGKNHRKRGSVNCKIGKLFENVNLSIRHSVFIPCENDFQLLTWMNVNWSRTTVTRRDSNKCQKFVELDSLMSLARNFIEKKNANQKGNINQTF